MPALIANARTVSTAYPRTGERKPAYRDIPINNKDGFVVGYRFCGDQVDHSTNTLQRHIPANDLKVINIRPGLHEYGVAVVGSVDRSRYGRVLLPRTNRQDMTIVLGYAEPSRPEGDYTGRISSPISGLC